MSDRTFTVHPSSDNDSSFEDIDGHSPDGPNEKNDDLAGAIKSAKELVSATLKEARLLTQKVPRIHQPEDMKDEQCDENAMLKSEISRLEGELRKAEELNKTKDSSVIDQLTQLNGMLMKENEDLQAKLRYRKVDEDVVNKADEVTDTHRARCTEFVRTMAWRESMLSGKLAFYFLFTILHAIVSLAFFYGNIRFNVPAVIISILLACLPFESHRTTGLRCAILVVDVLWIFTTNPNYYFVLMIGKTILTTISAWSICEEIIKKNTETRERLVTACCPAKFAGAEALRDGTPRIVEIYKSAGSLGIIISKPVDAPVYVAHIIPGGAAEKERGLRTGDEILKVNEKAVDKMTKEEVVSMLAWIDGIVRLEVRNNKELIAGQI